MQSKFNAYGSGFGITFANGYYVSVQFGIANYCENNGLIDVRFEDWGEEQTNCGLKGCKNAECAVFDPSGEMIEMDGWGDTVKGYMTVEEVFELFEKVKELK